MTLKLVVDNGPVAKPEAELTDEQLMDMQDTQFMMTILKVVHEHNTTDLKFLTQYFVDNYEGIPMEAIEYAIMTNLPDLMMSGAIKLDSTLSDQAVQILQQFEQLIAEQLKTIH